MSVMKRYLLGLLQTEVARGATVSKTGAEFGCRELPGEPCFKRSEAGA